MVVPGQQFGQLHGGPLDGAGRSDVRPSPTAVTARAEGPRKRCGSVREVRDGRLDGVSDRGKHANNRRRETRTGAGARKGRQRSAYGKEDRNRVRGGTAAAS
ncbi:hypothetical protein GCM10022284_11840 [Streptomyces hundungensis]